MFGTITSRRLQSYGFCSLAPAVRALPEWGPERRLLVARLVISLRKDHTYEKAMRWNPGQTTLPAVPLDTKLPVPWLLKASGMDAPSGQHAGGNPTRAPFAFACPMRCSE
eukprot:6845750-Alexandrium_andersonii.AAC.1